jgi:DNA-binding HxlR family transcriptional regulator
MDKKCPIEYTLSLISGKWKIIILKELSQEPVRYGALGKIIPGISPKVLSQHLREMESDGLIVREVFPEVPPRVEYSLSEMGKSISSILIELRQWGLEMDVKGITECTFCKKCQPHINS